MATKKMPEWFIECFPDWKKNLIGALRALFTGFVGVLVVLLPQATPETLVSPDFWINSVLIGGVSGALIYLGKWLRDKFFESSVAQKLPI